jgi:hypothetical protein
MKPYQLAELERQHAQVLQILKDINLMFGSDWTGAPRGIIIYRDSPLAERIRAAIEEPTA